MNKYIKNNKDTTNILKGTKTCQLKYLMISKDMKPIYYPLFAQWTCLLPHHLPTYLKISSNKMRTITFSTWQQTDTTVAHKG